MFKAIFSMASFIGLVFAFISWSDPRKRNPVAVRATVIPFNGLRAELGLDVPASEGAEEEEEEEE